MIGQLADKDEERRHTGRRRDRNIAANQASQPFQTS
jgi:hypothetical protein